MYDESDNLIAQGGPWSCDDGEAVIMGVLPGVNRRVVVSCLNASGRVIYRGERTGIEVTFDSIADAGIITVSSTNRAPVLATIAATGTMSQYAQTSLQFTISATDADGDAITYEAGNLPTGASFTQATGLFNWSSPTIGNYKVLFLAHDNGTPRRSDYEEVVIHVYNPAALTPVPPVLSPIGPQSVSQGDVLSFQFQTTDSPGASFTYSPLPVDDKASYPTGSLISLNTFTWNTISATPGNYYVNILVRNNSSYLEDNEEVTITVGNVNRPPVLTPIGSRTILVGETVSFVVTATDPEGDELTYSIESSALDAMAVEGASIDPTNQTLTWTVGDIAGGDYAVRIVVTDSHGETDFEDVMITVN